MLSDPAIVAAIVGAAGLVVLRLLDKLLARGGEERAARDELRADLARVKAECEAEHRRRLEAEGELDDAMHDLRDLRNLAERQDRQNRRP